MEYYTILLSRCRKNQDSYQAINQAQEDVRKFGNLPIPLKIRNAPTKLMKDLGYKKDYKLYNEEDYLPEKLKGRKYFKD